ncbi:L-threonylcarbamoyladenylate synthase [Desulfobulbus propionicus]
MSRIAAVSEESLRRAVDILHSGGIVAIPTETYYGLAVDPFDQDAVERLYKVKQRSRKLPILVLVHGVQQLPQVVASIPDIYTQLMTHFWPGPLTLVFPAHARICAHLTGGTGTVGVRHSPNPVANRLLDLFGRPVTATSANLSGMVPAISAQQVDQIFARQIDLVLDAGATPGGKGSSLVGLDGSELRCLREGKIPFAWVLQVVAASIQ